MVKDNGGIQIPMFGKSAARKLLRDIEEGWHWCDACQEWETYPTCDDKEADADLDWHEAQNQWPRG